MVREAVICNDRVKLSGRLIIQRAPATSSIEGNSRSSVVADDHAQVIVRINPKIVIILERGMENRKGFSSIGGLKKTLRGKRINSVEILWISIDMAVVILAATDGKAIVHQYPVFASVIRAVHAPILRLDRSPNAIGLQRRDHHSDLAFVTLRQAVC